MFFCGIYLGAVYLACERDSLQGHDEAAGFNQGKLAGKFQRVCSEAKMASSEVLVSRTNGKVRPHPTQNEALLFEKSSPGKRAYMLPPLDVPAVAPASLLGPAAREVRAELPELSEIEIIRHFTRLSTWNYAIDLGM